MNHEYDGVGDFYALRVKVLSPPPIMKRISRILLKAFKNEVRFVEHPALFTVDPLTQLLRIIHHLPFTWRKWILNICRIQEHPLVNQNLLPHSIQPQIVTFQLENSQSRTIEPADIISLIENFLDTPLSLCILSYFVRAESTAYPNEFQEQRDIRIQKELGAAVQFDSKISMEQAKSYLWFNMNKDDHTSFVHGMFTRGLRRLRTEFSRHHATLLLPYANDRKNVGYTTQHLYRVIKGTSSSSEWDASVTTGDLLRLYAETGAVVGGPMEVRVKWGFNDLQARVYYSLGGHGYFNALYIKPICNKICEILPSTNPFSRFDITRIHTITPEEIVVTYDYSAFTTSLSELKYFLYYLAGELEGIQIDVLDVFLGVTSIDLGEYIRSYNQAVNELQEVQVNRLFHGVDDYIRQGRSGSLGTQGNIVFSTTLHGLHLGEFSRTPFEDSCVGDDALVAIMANLLPLFIAHINVLGTIHPEKFTSLVRGETALKQNEQAFKYLKRPITVDMSGEIRTGLLDAFPDLFTAIGYETDSFRDSQNLTLEDRRKGLVTQWSRFLVIHQNDPVRLSYALEDHLYLLLELIGVCYDVLGIPREGCIPSHKLGRGDWKEVAHMYAPPCDDLDVFTVNWMDLLYQRYADDDIVVPFSTESVVGPEPDCLVTLKSRCSAGHPLVSIMRLLQRCTVRNVLVNTKFTQEIKEREMDRIFKGKGHTLAEVEFNNVPHWFEDVLMYYLDDIGLGDPFEAMSDFNTVISL